jgi:hypothetical protein
MDGVWTLPSWDLTELLWVYPGIIVIPATLKPSTIYLNEFLKK